MNPPISYEQAQELAANGSPALLHMVGRVFGLGDAERDALCRGAFPGWLWAAGGLALGFVAGVQVYRRWPEKVPALIKGKSR